MIVRSSRSTWPIGPLQSPGLSCQKIRMVGYHGLSVRGAIQRQQPS